MKIVVNSPLKIGEYIDVYHEQKISWKNASLRSIITHSDTDPNIIDIIKTAPIIGDRKNICIDVKVQYLKSNTCTCIPGWHTDTLVDIRHHTPPEHHHILVSGEHALTEFIANSFELDYYDGVTLLDLRKQIDQQNIKITTIPNNTWVSYTRNNFHRGAVPKIDGERLLIRVTETNITRPVTKPWKE